MSDDKSMYDPMGDAREEYWREALGTWGVYGIKHGPRAYELYLTVALYPSRVVFALVNFGTMEVRKSWVTSVPSEAAPLDGLLVDFLHDLLVEDREEGMPGFTISDRPNDSVLLLSTDFENKSLIAEWDLVV